jgi:hypothetical protein
MTMSDAITTLKKTLRGYSTQARYYAAGNIEAQADEQFLVIGWVRLGPAIVKPVFRHTDGTPVVLMDGRDHLTVLVCAVEPQAVVATEEQAWKGGRT